MVAGGVSGKMPYGERSLMAVMADEIVEEAKSYGKWVGIEADIISGALRKEFQGSSISQKDRRRSPTIS